MGTLVPAFEIASDQFVWLEFKRKPSGSHLLEFKQKVETIEKQNGKVEARHRSRDNGVWPGTLCQFTAARDGGSLPFQKNLKLTRSMLVSSSMGSTQLICTQGDSQSRSLVILAHGKERQQWPPRSILGT